MTDYQQQAEQEMYEAAQNVTAPREYAYSVIVRDTGARCLSTDSLDEARARAAQVGGYVLLADGSAYNGPEPDGIRIETGRTFHTSR